MPFDELSLWNWWNSKVAVTTRTVKSFRKRNKINAFNLAFTHHVLPRLVNFSKKRLDENFVYENSSQLTYSIWQLSYVDFAGQHAQFAPSSTDLLKESCWLILQWLRLFSCLTTIPLSRKCTIRISWVYMTNEQLKFRTTRKMSWSVRIPRSRSSLQFPRQRFSASALLQHSPLKKVRFREVRYLVG